MAVTTTKLTILDKAAIVAGGNGRWPSLGPSGRWPLPQTKAMPFLWPDYRSGSPQWHLTDYAAYAEEGYSQNALVYSAITFKARALMQVPLRAYTGTRDQPEPLDADHPLSKLCARPNPHQSFTEMQAQATVYLNLDGNCYLYFDRPSRGALPTAMYSLRPDRVFIVPGKERNRSGVAGYLYVPEGKSQWGKWNRARRRSAFDGGEVMGIMPEDLMHVKLPNPLDPLEGMGYGLSPLSPGARETDIDNMATNFLKLFFQHGTMVTGLLSFDVPMTDDTVARARERWKEIYGGFDNWSEIAVLDQGGKYQRIAPTVEELGLEGIDSRNESRILMPFGVPGMLLGTRYGLERSTYSNMEEAQVAVWRNTLLPESKLFEVEYSYFLRDDTSWTAYDYGDVRELQEDISGKVADWAVLVDRGVPKDVAAGVVSLPLSELPDDGVGYLPLNLIPVGVVAPTTATTTEQGAASATEEERGEGKALAWDDLKKNRPRVGG